MQRSLLYQYLFRSDGSGGWWSHGPTVGPAAQAAIEGRYRKHFAIPTANSIWVFKFYIIMNCRLLSG